MSRTVVWQNGKKKVKGSWSYVWASDCFVIRLDSYDPITGEPRIFRVYDDHPEWGNWKRVVQDGKEFKNEKNKTN